MKRVDRARRAARESPYQDEHLASIRPTAGSGFASMLAWFVDGFAAETPARLHAAGVWFGSPDLSSQSIDPTTNETLSSWIELGGGSQLGAPRLDGSMRQLLENSPKQVYDQATPDARYARPMRAALAHLASRDADGWYAAKYLAQVGYARGDWQAVAHRWFPAHGFVARSFTEMSLRRLVACYRLEPPPNWIKKSDSQRAAEEATDV